MDQTTSSPHPVTKLLQNVSWLILSVYIILAPLAFSSVTLGSIYDFPKWMLTVSVAILMIFLWSVRTLITRKVELPSFGFTLPLTLTLAATVISMIASRSHIVPFLLGKGGFLIAFILIVLFGAVMLGQKATRLLSAVVVSGLVMALVQILAFFELFQKIVKDPVVTGKTFTPLGSQLTLVTFLAIILPIAVYLAFRTSAVPKKVVLFLVSGIITVALVLGVAQLLPGQPANPRLMPFYAGWSLAVDQLKTGKTALFGAGPDRFIVTFSQLRPASLNQGDLWYVRYAASTNEWLTILTTLGIAGLAAFVLTILAFSRVVLQQKRDISIGAIGIAWVAVLLLLTVLPSNFSSLLLLFVLMLMLAGASVQAPIQWESKGTLAVAVPALILALVMFYFSGRSALAEVAFGQSLLRGSENKYVEMYNKQIEAIDQNKFVSRYHLSYSNTNFIIANALASKTDLTDDDRQKITQLISQSIREAKTSVSLDPENPNSWVNLAAIYRQLINFAEGADQWAIASYIQAIRLDNTNPQLRIDLGGLLFSLQRYEEAIDQFKQAIVLKPDYANAYYNLSNAYKATNQPVQSYAAMQNVVQLIDPNSADYDKALAELNELQKLLPQQTQQATAAAAQRQSALTTPSPIPSPSAQPVQFDQNQQQELAPEVENTPAPSATPVPTQAPETSPTPTNP